MECPFIENYPHIFFIIKSISNPLFGVIIGAAITYLVQSKLNIGTKQRSEIFAFFKLFTEATEKINYDTAYKYHPRVQTNFNKIKPIISKKTKEILEKYIDNYEKYIEPGRDLNHGHFNPATGSFEKDTNNQENAIRNKSKKYLKDKKENVIKALMKETNKM